MLTEKQEAILAYVRDYQVAEGVPPSSRRLQNHFGFRTQTTVIRHLRALAALGQVQQFADGRWGIRPAAAVQAHLPGIPVYGSIPAGLPGFAEQQPERRLPFTAQMLGLKTAVWAVRVHGDSMSGAHIVEGDIAIMERREPRSGEIIAALVNGTDVTLKQFVRAGSRAILRAANSRYPDIHPETLECQGVLAGLFRPASAIAWQSSDLH